MGVILMKKILIAGRKDQTENYVAAVQGVGAIPTVSLDLQDPDDFDGLLMPGGYDINPALFGQENAGSNGIDDDLDQRQMAILDVFVKAKKPILGICRGLQVLNVYFGGTLIQHLENHQIHRCPGTDLIHTTKVTEDCFLNRIYESNEFVTNSCHHQAIDRLGKGLKPVQYAEGPVIEAVIHETLPIIALQWHPERMAFAKRREDTVDGEKIFRYFLTMLENH